MPDAMMIIPVASQSHKLRQMTACSRCGVVYSHRSFLQGIRQRLLRLLTIGSSYRCEACIHRTMALREAQSALQMRFRA
jgi:hypothetical protein